MELAVTDTAHGALRPRNIGARIKRVEDRRLLTGQGMFTDDRAVPGALHLAFLRSIHAHALIACIEVGAAIEMPGVVGIYAAEHLETLVSPIRATSRMRNYHATPIYPLARGKVRYVGEPIEAVLAESRYLAEDALDPIELAYEIHGRRLSNQFRSSASCRVPTASRHIADRCALLRRTRHRWDPIVAWVAPCRL